MGVKDSYLVPIAGIVSFFLIALPASGGDAAKKDTWKPKVSPKTALQAAAKNLTKSVNYKTTVVIEGGLSEREDHGVTEKTMGETYEGEVFSTPAGSLMHVPHVGTTTIKAFRYPNRGTAYIQGAWRDIMSERTTLRLNRLFTFPEVYLARALSGANTMRWLTPDEERALIGDRSEAAKPKEEPKDDDASGVRASASAGDDEEGEDEAKPAPKKTDTKKADTKKKGPTSVVKPKAADDGPQPRVVRVEVPPKEALQYFTEVQNSGCMSAG